MVCQCPEPRPRFGLSLVTGHPIECWCGGVIAERDGSTYVAKLDTEPTVILSVSVDKYEVRQYSDGRVTVLRNGGEWRDVTGDKLVLALAHEIDSLTVKP